MQVSSLKSPANRVLFPLERVVSVKTAYPNNVLAFGGILIKLMPTRISINNSVEVIIVRQPNQRVVGNNGPLLTVDRQLLFLTVSR